MSRRFLLASSMLALLVVVGALGGVFVLREERHATRQDPERAPSDGSISPVALSPLEPAGVAIPEAAIDESARSVVRPPRESVDRESTDALTDALWVEGRVLVPQGTPPEERVEVVAEGNRFQSLGFHASGLRADGSFRVAFAPGTESGLLTLRARFLYLAKKYPIDPRDPPDEIKLRPELGGCIGGRLVARSTSFRLPRTLIGQRVRATSTDGIPGTGIYRTTKISSEFEFELGGLPADKAYDVEVRADTDWCVTRRDEVRVIPGERSVLELDALRPASIRGIVVDEVGHPFARARVQSSAEQSPALTARSDREGRFRLDGVHPGNVVLVAGASESIWTKLSIGEVEAGAVVEDVRLVLPRVEPIWGRVVWPDGRPAAHCRVLYEFDRRSASGQLSRAREELIATSDGRFEIPPGPSTVDLTARTMSAPQDRDRADSTASTDDSASSVWVCRLKEIPSGTEGLVLELEPGRSIHGQVVDVDGRPIRGTVLVGAVRVGGPATGEWDWEVAGTCREEGRFVLDGLHDGTWRLTAKAGGYVPSEEVVVRIPGQSPSVPIAMARGASVSGMVVDPLGRPVVDAWVVLSRWRESTEERPVGRTARTDSGGRFSITEIAPGAIELGAAARGRTPGKTLSVELLSGESLEDVRLVVGEPTQDEDQR